MQYYLHMVTREFWTERIQDAWRHRSVVWLYGVRRAGKTTLCQSLPGIVYFDCELPSVRRQMEDPEIFLDSLRGASVAIDEIQRLPRPSELLKIAADHYPDVRVIATGSSTLGASAKFADTLTGRKADVWLTPMAEADRVAFGPASLEDRLWYGGMPPFFLGRDEVPAGEYQSWVDSFWAKDIQELFRLERRASFVRFMELLFVNSGGMFEATSYAAPCEVSRTTISNYLNVLSETRIAHVVRPFSTRRATEIVSAPKVYGFDTGFIRHFRGLEVPRPEDFGWMWEHYVLNEIHARCPQREVRYWRTKQHQEVDFVVTRAGRSPLAIECKWSESGLGTLSGLAAFAHAYPDAELCVVAPSPKREYAYRLKGRQVTVTNLQGLVDRL